MRLALVTLLVACGDPAPSSIGGDDQPPVDAAADAAPGALDYGERCDDGIDNDGDGRVDEDCAPSLFGGVFAPQVSADPGLATLEDAAGRSLGVLQTYRTTATQVDLDRTYTDLIAIFARGQVPHLNIEMNYPKAAYADPSANPLAADLVAMGSSIARALDATPAGRVFVTFGAEMNGAWTSWGCLSPATFIALYRHAHGVITAQLDARGIDHRRVRWVYGPDANGGGNAQCASGPAYYPGHAYVDLLGLSAYRHDGASVDTAVLAPMNRLFDGIGIPAEARRDRFVLLQTGSREVAGRDAWITDLFSKLAADPRVAGIIYFNAYDWAVAPGAGWDGLSEALRDAPIADRALEGTFAPHFWDVAYGDPAFGEIQALKDHGVTSGCATEPAMFCPDAPLDRGAAIVFLTSAFGAAPLADGPEPLTERELAGAIEAAGGTPPTATDAVVTRARGAVLIARGARLVPNQL